MNTLTYKLKLSQIEGLEAEINKDSFKTNDFSPINVRYCRKVEKTPIPRQATANKDTLN